MSSMRQAAGLAVSSIWRERASIIEGLQPSHAERRGLSVVPWAVSPQPRVCDIVCLRNTRTHIVYSENESWSDDLSHQ